METEARDSQRVVLPPGSRGQGPPPPSDRLTENQVNLARVLLAAGPITREYLEQQLSQSGKGETSVGKALLASGFPSESALVYPLLAGYRIPRLNVANVRIIPEVRDLIPADAARRLQVVPIDRVGDILVVASPDIFNPYTIEELRLVTRCRVSVVQCDEAGLAQALQKYYPDAPRVGPAPVARVDGAPPGGVRETRVVRELAGLRPGPTVLRVLAAEPPTDGRPVAGRFLDVEARYLRLFESAGPLPVEEVQM